MKSENPGMTAAQLLAILNARLTNERLGFNDDFNRAAEDTDVWTSGGDGGSFALPATINDPTAWRLTTGAVIDNDYYINGDVIKNKAFSIFEEGYTTVTWESRIRLQSIADVSALFGLLRAALTDYAEPPNQSTIFFVDPAITNTFRARSFGAAEQETDTLVALDTDYHTFKIVWIAASVLFYINDVLVATHATQVPNGRMFSEILIRTEAATTKYLDIDYVKVELS